MGLISFMLRGEATLLTARTRDFFHAIGKIDSPIDLLNISNTYFPMNGKAAVITLFGSSSLPLAEVLKWSMDDDISCKVTGEKEKRGYCSFIPSISAMTSETGFADGSYDIELK